jgi:two-component system, cell cycle response regulator DivK
MEESKYKTTVLPTEGLGSDSSEPETAAIRSYLVLIVDDVVDNLQLMSLNLQNLGYRVVTAVDGEDAVKVATLMRPDVILMDIAMPILDGLGAARKIGQDITLKHIPIIALSAFSTDGFLQAAYDVGFAGYLTKPVDMDKVQDLITSLCPVL